MADHEELRALRDAYYDMRDVVGPFVSPWWDSLLEGLSDEDAEDEFQILKEELIEDGYTSKEISLIGALAICDIQNEMLEDIENYEAEA